MDNLDRLRRVELESSLRELRRVNGDSVDGMGFQDMLYLDIIHCHDGCTASFIADSLGIARSAVTVRLNRLEKNGWIERVRSEEDRRQYILRLTGETKAVYDDYARDMGESLRRLSERYSEEEVGKFMDMMEFLVGTFYSEENRDA